MQSIKYSKIGIFCKSQVDVCASKKNQTLTKVLSTQPQKEMLLKAINKLYTREDE